MLGIGLACIKCAARAVVQIAGGGGTPPPITKYYRQPDNSLYKQPDGTSYYLQP